MTRLGPREALDAAYSAFRLKDEPRAGWVLHGVTAPETVAAHSWGTAYLCLLFGEAAGVNVERAVAIAVLHDLAEAETGDLLARADSADRTVTEAEKRRLEAAAIARLLPPGTDVLEGMWRSYEERADDDARFVRDMNLIDMCLEALRYERGRRYDPAVVVTSAGDHRHLDEFFLSARSRLHGEFAQRLFALIHADYQDVRRGGA